MIGAYITASAIMVSALIAIGLGVYNAYWAKKASRVKETFDTLNKKQWDKDYILASSVFKKAIESGDDGLTKSIMAEEANENDVSEDQNEMSVATAARLIMNDYELMFISVEQGVLDEKLYRLWKGSSIIRHYDVTKSYVESMRISTKNKTLFKVFQRNAEKWKKTKKEWDAEHNDVPLTDA